MKTTDLKFLPKNLDFQTKISRYMSFSKFFNLVVSEKIFVPHASTLVDKYEGIPHYDHEIHLISALEKLGGSKSSLASELVKKNKAAKNYQDIFSISCWAEFKDIDSYLMWMAYSNNFDGVSIITTVEGLIESLKKIDGDVYLDRVSYRNRKDKYPDDIVDAYFKKAGYYEDEREIRLIIDNLSIWKSNGNKLADFDLPNGLLIPVDIKLLIKKIIVAPLMPATIKASIVSFLKEKNINVEVAQSAIARDPIVDAGLFERIRK